MQINAFTSLQWIFVLILLISTINGITWLGIARFERKEEKELAPFSDHDCAIVSTNYGLKKRQTNFCYSRRHSFAMPGIIKAAQAAIFHCINTFADRRWNCSTAEKLPKLHKDLEIGTQEQAIVHAFSSAALMYEISRGCSRQEITYCSCGTDPYDTYTPSRTGNRASRRTNTYSGCADNIRVGVKYVKKFTGFHRMGRNIKRKRKIRNKKLKHLRRLPYFLRKQLKLRRLKRKIIKRINGHNYEAGIQILLDNSDQHCVCQGASTSCTYKVCFRQLRRIDDTELKKRLKEKYLSARYVEVDANNNIKPVQINLQRSVLAKSSATSRQTSPVESSTTVQMNHRTRFKRNSIMTRNSGYYPSAPVKKDDLVFIQHSPDYCEYDMFSGSLGTHNRLCKENVDITSTIHCSNMCCGRKYREELHNEKVTCGCKVDNSFQILCNRCNQTVSRHYCN